MLYPVGEYVHQNLSTTFTDVHQLLNELKETRFTGYMSVHYWGFEALIIVDAGQIIQAFIKTDKEIISGLEALEIIYEKILEKDGDINVVRIDNELTLMLSALPYAEEKNQKFLLNNDTLVKIQNLLEEKGFSAIIATRENQSGIDISLFFYEGQLLTIAGKQNNELFLMGLNDLGKLIKFIKTTPIESSIYYINIHKSVEVLEDFALQATFNRWKEYYEKLFHILFKSFEVQHVDVLNLKKIFQENRLQLADQYGFLDPFLEILEIKDGELQVNEFINIYDFINGMDELIYKSLQSIKESKIKKIDGNEIHFLIQKESENYLDLMEKIPVDRRKFGNELTGV
ncbi:MAG: hypothetical protein Kow00108_16450 [Calditrichia bacterium]